MSVTLLSPVPVFSPIPCFSMSLLSPVPAFSSIPSHLRYATIGQKTPTWPTMPTITWPGHHSRRMKKGESPNEKVLHANRLCQKCMSRNGNVSLTELAWQAGCHEICWHTPWPSASPPLLSAPSNTPSSSVHYQYCFGRCAGGVYSHRYWRQLLYQ